MFPTSTTTSDQLWTLTDPVAAFAVRELGVHRVRGTIHVTSGHVTVDADGEVSSLTATLDPAGVATGSARRDADLRGRRFFDVASRPQWTFVADSVERTDGGWAASGTLHGVALCRLSLHITEVESLDGVRQFAATSTIDRRAAAIRAPRFLIGRHVDVELRGGLVASRRADGHATTGAPRD
jgi:polyisoprenoid-binding protein YceI